MKLRQTMDVMCTTRSHADYRPSPYDCLQQCGLNGTDEHVIVIRFEYEMWGEKGGQGGKKRKKTGRPARVPPAPVSSNPIHELLHSRTEHRCIDTLQKQKQKQRQKQESSFTELSAESPSSSTPVVPTTQSTWNLRAVAPLIQWLQMKRVRYIHSDWVNEFSNGERVCVVSQRGVLLSNRQITNTKHYRCHSAFHGIHMQCARTAINVHNQNNSWWKETNKTDTGLHNGILHSTYQQRIYAWDKHTYIYLTTADGQVYNVSVEHQRTDTTTEEDHASLHTLLTSLSYHLSKHTRQQKKY